MRIKEETKRGRKIQAYFQIYLMIASTIAFSFIFNSLFAETVSAATYYDTLVSQGYQVQGNNLVKESHSIAAEYAKTLDAAGKPVLSTTNTGTSKHMISSWLELPAGETLDALVTGAQWAGIAYGAGMLIGGLFGMEK